MVPGILEAVPERPQSEESTKGNRTIRFVRHQVHGATVLMGRVARSYITGEVALVDHNGFPDFVLVDLAHRPGQGLTRSERELVGDKYLFKPVPLLYRTWIYHSTVKAKKLLTGTFGENSLMKYVLSQNCIDVPVVAGRSSPLPYWVPLAIATCLMGSQVFVVFTIAIVLFLLLVSSACNSPSLYRFARLIHLPVRLGFLVVLFAFTEIQGILAVVGFVLTLLIFVADLVTGDLSALLALRINCTYELIQHLGNRVYVCYRHGAFGIEDSFGDRGIVAECVSKMPVWERSHYLLADIGDLLVELRPLSPEDWSRIIDQYLDSGEPIPYLAVDLVTVKAQEEFVLREARSRRFTLMAASAEKELQVEDF